MMCVGSCVCVCETERERERERERASERASERGREREREKGRERERVRGRGRERERRERESLYVSVNSASYHLRSDFTKPNSRRLCSQVLDTRAAGLNGRKGREWDGADDLIL